jgi:hypothetical protein
MKRTPDQSIYQFRANKIIGQKLKAYYQVCITEQIPPRLLALLKKLDEEIEPSAEHVEKIEIPHAS